MFVFSTPIPDTITTTQKAWSFKPATWRQPSSLPHRGSGSCRSLQDQERSYPGATTTFPEKCHWPRRAEEGSQRRHTLSAEPPSSGTTLGSGRLLGSAGLGMHTEQDSPLWPLHSLRSKLYRPIRLLREACLVDDWALSCLSMKLGFRSPLGYWCSRLFSFRQNPEEEGWVGGFASTLNVKEY